ncbi:MAG: DUF4124 domain-containing protein [Gammaproteobacteria bacterium]|jgi:hypothetical protein|nr:DUF4124 domain-containing protein [Gammaproteobacteria bacterium]
MRKFILTVALVTLSSSVLARDEQKVYKWVDEDGNVFFSDKIPVDASDHPKDVLNDRGVTIDNLEGKKTAEQLEQERKENELRVAQELQVRADRALLATYLSVDEIEMHRDRRVELFQAQTRVTELYLRNLETRLQKLRNDASRYQPYNTDSKAPMIDEGLAENLRKTKDTISRHQRNLTKYENDEKQIIERFDGDIARFKILKGIE